MTLSAIAFLVTMSTPAFDFTPHGPYDSAVTTPESVLGYKAGEKHTVYRDQERVVLAIARTAPKRVKVFEFGMSWEGRPLRVVAISSEKNIAKLEELRKQMQMVANGDTSDATKNALATLPTFVWINETIHGDESASFESGMWFLYNLAASRNAKITSALDNTVVLLNPVYNPDGHERFAVWNRALGVGSDHPDAFEADQPSWVSGRVNHYRFDMNRDRVALSQAETRAEVTEFFKWNPQVYVDQHGQTSEYFFPPNPMSVHAGVNRDRFNKWTEVFGRDYAKAFDENGWLYFVRESFDLYYAGYLDSFTSLAGAIGMTHETDGGRRLNDKKDDGSPLNLEMGMAKHFTSAISTVTTASTHRKALLDSYYGFKRRAVTGEHAGKFQRVVVTSDDPRPLVRLQERLSRANVSSYFAGETFKVTDSHDFWSDAKGDQTFPQGSLIVDMAQPQGPLAKALLEPGQDFEAEFIKRQIDIVAQMEKREPKYGMSEFPEFYDVTGWSLIYGYQLKAWWTESAPKITSQSTLDLSAKRAPIPDATVGWVVEYKDDEDALGIWKLLEGGVKGRLIVKSMTLGGETYKPGGVLFLKGRNEPDLKDRIANAFPRATTTIRPVSSAFPDTGKNSPGTDAVVNLRQPKVAVIFGSMESITQFGSTWFTLTEELGIEFTPLPTSALSGDLSEFSAVVLPPGRYTSIPSSFREWISSGGCAVVMGSPGWAIGDGKLAKLEVIELEGKKPIRSIPGAYFLAELEGRSFLSFGYGVPDGKKAPFAVQVDGSRFYKSDASGNPAVAFADKDATLLSGWSWPDNSAKALKNSVVFWDQEIGRGRAVIFMNDPTERAMFPGLHKVFINAMMFGPR